MAWLVFSGTRYPIQITSFTSRSSPKSVCRPRKSDAFKPFSTSRLRQVGYANIEKKTPALLAKGRLSALSVSLDPRITSRDALLTSAGKWRSSYSDFVYTQDSDARSQNRADVPIRDAKREKGWLSPPAPSHVDPLPVMRACTWSDQRWFKESGRRAALLPILTSKMLVIGIRHPPTHDKSSDLVC